MPRESKKRGRRMENGKKRKHEDEEEDVSTQPESVKRRKSIDDAALNADFIPFDAVADNGDLSTKAERPFYGLLDEEEQEFFRRADETLEANDFQDENDKKAFLTNIYKEASGKELKIANSQGCSRLLERLIQLSSAEQCSNLFEQFSGNFVSLMTHRFASHCCEALFVRGAPLLTEEMSQKADSSLEACYLGVLKEIEGNIGYLITDQYASHVLRVLLLVLAGEPLLSTSNRQLLRSKRKEVISVKGVDEAHTELNGRPRPVPKSFHSALEKLIKDSVSGLSTDKLRAFATHPNANPPLQLLLRLELSHLGKQRAKDEKSIIRTLLPEDPIKADSDSATFLSGMIYDPIGSHLVETIITAAPAKLFKNLFKAFLFERIPSYARNEIASHVACRVIERLGHDDLLNVHEAMVDHISDLLRKNRTNVVRTLIERCTVREIDTKVIALQVYNTWNNPDGFEIEKLLKTVAPAIRTNDDNTPVDEGGLSETVVTEPIKAHFNLLAQTMLLVPGALSALILDSLVTLEPEALLEMSKDHIVSRTLQAALTSKSSSIIITRKLVQHFYGSIGEMAVDKSASHVVDCIWEGTHGLAFIRERIAEELAENEAQLRDNVFGRAVWKNWKMDIYKRRRDEWIRQSRVKASNDGFQSFSEIDATKTNTGEAKTPLQLARERHARDKQKKQEPGNRNNAATRSAVSSVTDAVAGASNNNTSTAVA